MTTLSRPPALQSCLTASTLPDRKNVPGAIAPLPLDCEDPTATVSHGRPAYTQRDMHDVLMQNLCIRVMHDRAT